MGVLILMQTINGLASGMLYAITAFGLTFILGMLNIPNFAHGALFTLGAYLGLTLFRLSGNFWLTLLIAPLGVGLLGMLLEWGLLRRVYFDEPEAGHYQLLLTFAVAVVLQELIILIWSPVGQSILPPKILRGALNLGVIYYPKYRIFVVIFSAFLILAVWLFLERTKMGAIIRAGIENREMVMVLGINIYKLFTVSFGLGVLLAGIGGVLILPIRGANPFMGFDLLAIAFVVVALGGLGNLFGAIFAGLIIGVAQSLVSIFFPAASWVAVYAAMAIVLIFRPHGLFGTR